MNTIKKFNVVCFVIVAAMACRVPESDKSDQFEKDSIIFTIDSSMYLNSLNNVENGKTMLITKGSAIQPPFTLESSTLSYFGHILKHEFNDDYSNVTFTGTLTNGSQIDDFFLVDQKGNKSNTSNITITALDNVMNIQPNISINATGTGTTRRFKLETGKLITNPLIFTIEPSGITTPRHDESQGEVSFYPTGKNGKVKVTIKDQNGYSTSTLVTAVRFEIEGKGISDMIDLKVGQPQQFVITCDENVRFPLSTSVSEDYYGVKTVFNGNLMTLTATKEQAVTYGKVIRDANGISYPINFRSTK